MGGMRVISGQEREALLEVAAKLRLQDPQLLAELIEFESGWNPQAKNPNSSASGLIQFMRKTAGRLVSVHDVDHDGDRDSVDLVLEYPDAASQLRGPVLEYLLPMAPFVDRPPALPGQSLFMAVFFPAARRWDPSYRFVDVLTPQRAQQFTEQNPGIVTVRDYVEHVRRRAGTVTLA